MPLVRRLGLFDSLSGRLAICGTPDDCLAQVCAAQASGVDKLTLTVSLASASVRTVKLFGRLALPLVP